MNRRGFFGALLGLVAAKVDQPAEAKPPPMRVELHPGEAELDMDNLHDAMSEYQNGLQRYCVLRGVTIEKVR